MLYCYRGVCVCVCVDVFNTEMVPAVVDHILSLILWNLLESTFESIT